MTQKRSRSWPTGNIDLLLKAVLAPEDKARAAWKRWTELRNFDDITWSETRLLVPLGRRMQLLDPSSPLRPRIDGVAKLLWTRTHLHARDMASAFELLDKAHIPFMVFKGGALYADGLALATRRIMGDVDILVPREQALGALETLLADGWTSDKGASSDYMRRIARVRCGYNLRKGEVANIDVHSEPFHFSRIGDAFDREMWARAETRNLASRSVLVPDATDSVLLLLAHSAASESGDWAVDLAIRVEKTSIDWRRFAASAERLGLVPICRAGLDYLRTELEAPVPREAADALASASASRLERVKYWSAARPKSERTFLEKAADLLANRLLRRQGYHAGKNESRAVAIVRRSILPVWLLPAGRAADAEATLSHTVDISDPARLRRLLLGLELQRPATRRRILFEVSVDGVAIAQLRCRSRRGKAGSKFNCAFTVPLPKEHPEPIRIAVSARPSRYLSPDASAAELKCYSAVPFKLTAVSVI
jgi:putative nucleotidyltransferase-like protein